jgi:hypothetical protein
MRFKTLSLHKPQAINQTRDKRAQESCAAGAHRFAGQVHLPIDKPRLAQAKYPRLSARAFSHENSLPGHAYNTMSYNMHGSCWHCGQRLQERDYARETRCPACGKPTHVCRNCRYYKPGAPADCSEPVADPVSDKTRANFCGYFEAAQPQAETSPDAADLRQAAEDLFDL